MCSGSHSSHARAAIATRLTSHHGERSLRLVVGNIGERDGSESGGGRVVRGARGTRGRGRGKVRDRLGGRASLRVVVGCGLLMALTPPAAQARPRLEGHPKPPSQAQINAAENQVRQHQAALGTEQGKLSAANAELSKLQTQAEVLIERYDQAQVNEQRAASAYQVTEARLRQAER